MQNVLSSYLNFKIYTLNSHPRYERQITQIKCHHCSDTYYIVHYI